MLVRERQRADSFGHRLGIDPDYRPARKAHPALCCRNYHQLIARLRAASVEVKDDDNIPGVCRCHLSDPFGNRIELIASEGTQPIR